jgi:hypothetical protein
MENKPIRKKFDKEFATAWKSEYQYLESVGIKPSFIKDIDNIETYKYTKNSKLFEALRDFYLLLENK